MAILTITKANFEAEVQNSDKPVLLDFYATWCGPCRLPSPAVEEIAAERTDIKVGKINVDDEGELANQFNIASIPTIILVKDGKVAATSIGYKEKNSLLSALGL